MSLSRSSDERRRDGFQKSDSVVWRKAHLQSALTAIHINEIVNDRLLLDRSLHVAHLAERTDAADPVARHALRVGRLHHLRRLTAERRRKPLHRYFAVGRDDDTNRLAVDQRHQRLEYAMRWLAQSFRSLQTDAVG